MADANTTPLVKKCTRCSTEYPATTAHFSPLKSGIYGIQAWCKPCMARQKREDRASRPEHYSAIEKRRHERHKDKRLAANRAAWAANEKYKEVASKRQKEMREVYNANSRAAHAASPEKRREAQRRHRRANPDLYSGYAKKSWARAGRGRRLRTSMGAAISKSVKRGTKQGKRWEQLVGYTTTDLMQHLERQFLKGMSWDNYGDWHIDHIIPVASFDIERPDSESFMACWALSNLRPLWAGDNIRKSATITHLI